jgi:phosphatidylglycerol:prolipoprotein diacylglycerol transferase
MFEWAGNPEIFVIPGLDRGIRWYGLLFALGFLAGFQFFRQIFRAEGKNEKDLDSLLMHVIVGTIVGARLGHCLFYEPTIYLNDPIRILYVWEGGLASHGGTLGNIISVFIYSLKHKDQPYIWLADRIAFPIALAGCLIRLGNFFNSEIIGRPTDLPWGVHFGLVDSEKIFRHPSMLYESLSYFVIFLILRNIYWRYTSKTPPGLLIGLFAIMVFGARFVIEFTKENQVAFESAMPINMGQLLSIPFVIVGILLVMYSRKHTPQS